MKPNREGNLVSEYHRQCTACGIIFEKNGVNTMTICRSCNTTRVKNGQSAEQKMLQRARNRSKNNKIECNLELSDIFIPEKCPILKIPLVVHSGSSGGKFNSPALDRIDNTKGYIRGNVWVISHRANQMKVDANIKELKLFAEWIQTLKDE
jgi:predicted  nucleic acid-binding Zn-ribbon protein